PGCDPTRRTRPGNSAAPGPGPTRPAASHSSTASVESSTKTWGRSGTPVMPDAAEPNTRVTPSVRRQRPSRSATVVTALAPPRATGPGLDTWWPQEVPIRTWLVAQARCARVEDVGVDQGGQLRRLPTLTWFADRGAVAPRHH